jgi:hypothetical protein
MAPIKKTEYGTWTVRYEKPTGGKKRRQGTATFKKHADARAFKTQNDAAILTGTYIDPRAARLDFGTWAERWLDTRTNLKPKTRTGTNRSYASTSSPASPTHHSTPSTTSTSKRSSPNSPTPASPPAASDKHTNSSP